MYLDILNSPNSPQQIYHPKYTSLSRKKEIKLYDIFQNYFNKTLIEDVICENCPLVNLGKKKPFAVWRNLKEPP